MLKLDSDDKRYILEKTGKIELYLASIRFDDNIIDDMFSYAVAGGRRARPVMVLMAADAVGGNPEKIIAVACAVELGHKASLINDDIVDDDCARRGRKSFWKKYGIAEAVITSDLLIGKAFALLNDLEIEDRLKLQCYELFSEVFQTMSAGQAKDYSYERKKDISLTESSTMIYEKTAILCEMPMRLGGLLAGASKQQIKSLSTYGANMGIAFQMLNDINNVTGYEKKTGRGTPTDFIRGKKTSIIAYALEQAEYDHDILKTITSDKTINAVLELAKNHMRKAQKALESLPKSRAQKILNKLSDPQVMRLDGYFGLLEGLSIPKGDAI